MDRVSLGPCIDPLVGGGETAPSADGEGGMEEVRPRRLRTGPKDGAQTARTMRRKSAAFSEAPPTSAPPTSSIARSSAAFVGLTEPP